MRVVFFTSLLSFKKRCLILNSLIPGCLLGPIYVNHFGNIEAKLVFFSAVQPKDKNIHFCETTMQPLLYIRNSRTNNSNDMRPLERHTCMFKFRGIFSVFLSLLCFFIEIITYHTSSDALCCLSLFQRPVQEEIHR
jgi:hypothetical protein